MAPDQPARLGVLTTDRLVLEPLSVAHAAPMFAGLSEAALYEHLDEGPPASLEWLEARYRRLARGGPEDGRQRWYNWCLRRRAGDDYVGYVQATVDEGVAHVAYVLFRGAWGQGLATEAVAAMMAALRDVERPRRFEARVAARNVASMRVLIRCGLLPRATHDGVHADLPDLLFASASPRAPDA